MNFKYLLLLIMLPLYTNAQYDSLKIVDEKILIKKLDQNLYDCIKLGGKYIYGGDTLAGFDSIPWRVEANILFSKSVQVYSDNPHHSFRNFYWDLRKSKCLDGYVYFIQENNGYNKTTQKHLKTLTITQNHTPIDVIKKVQCKGEDFTNKDLINLIKKWELKLTLIVINDSYCEVLIEQLPNDFDNFVKDYFELTSQILNDGFDNNEKLFKEYLKQDRMMIFR